MTDNEDFQALQATKISRCLSMDTATSAMTVAILENGRLLGEISTHAERNHSIGLLPNIQELLATVELSAKDLHAVIVGNGPGSYTGVRIGVTVAKTFAWSLGMDLIGVSSLEAMSLGGRRRYLGQADSSQEPSGDGELTQEVELDEGEAGSSIQWIIPLMDARRSQAFTGIYEAKGNWHPQKYMLRDHKSVDEDVWRQLVPDGIHLMQPWLEQLETMALDKPFREKLTGIAGLKAPDKIIFVGETTGFEALLIPFSQRLGTMIQVIPHLVEAYDIGLLGMAKRSAGKLEEVHNFVPNYAQLPEAEVNYLAAKAQLQVQAQAAQMQEKKGEG